MTGRWWLIWAGFALSLVLMVILLSRLDWSLFWNALRGLAAEWLLATAICVVAGIGIRALRWNALAAVPAANYRHFWQAANLGYLSNYIYPARAGELVRMAVVNRFGRVPAGLAVTSAVMDRVADGLLLGGMALVVAGIHSPAALGQAALAGILGVFGAAGLCVLFFLIWGDRWQMPLARWSAWLPKKVPGLVLQGKSKPWRAPARCAGLCAWPRSECWIWPSLVWTTPAIGCCSEVSAGICRWQRL